MPKVMWWISAVWAAVIVIVGVGVWLIFIHTARVPKESFDTLSREELLDKASTGDLILLSGTTYGEKLIKRLSGSCYSHVGLVLKQDGKVWLWEADLGQRHKDGPRLILLSEKLDRWTGSKVGGWIPLSPGTTRPSPEKVLEIIYPHTTKEMDRKMTKWLAASHPDSWLYSSMSEPNKVYCSELVAMTLMELGLLDTSHSPAWYSPQTFANRGDPKSFRLDPKK